MSGYLKIWGVLIGGRVCRRAAGALAATVLLAVCWSLAADPALAADAPDPGGYEDAELSGAPAGKEFGFSGVLHVGELDSSTVADLTARAGGNAARTPMSWAGLEPNRDKYNETGFANYSRLYDALTAEGIRPTFIILAAPVWARDSGAPQSCGTSSSCVYPPARSMLGEWNQFVAEVTRRFPRATIEVWNEPNFKGTWQSGVDPERYAELLASAYDAIKGVNPQAKVFSGGLGGTLKPDSLGAAEFLDRAYAANPSLKGHTDAVNFHYYPAPRLGAGTAFAQHFADIRAVRSKYGDEQTPLYVTETGSTTTGPFAANEDEQADLVMRATRKMLTMPDVSGVLVHTLAEPTFFAADDPERGYGVVRATSGLLGPAVEPKLAYCALTRAAGQLDLDCPPETAIDSAPAQLGNSADVEFRFSSPDAGVVFECSLDGGAFGLCTSPRRYTGLAEGGHSFQVRARDLLGRVDPYPARFDFRVDLTPPGTELSGPTGSIKETRPQYTATSDDPQASFECSLDGGGFFACGSVFSYLLTEGAHTIAARAVDPAGNRDATPATISVTVDNTLPDTAITSSPPSLTNSREPSFSFTSSEGEARFECALDSFDYQPCTSPYLAAPLGDGFHAFRVRSRDPAGNVDSSPAVATFTVDTQAPAVAFTSTPGPYTNDTTPTVYFAADESGSALQCRVDSGEFAGCSSPYTTRTLEPGSHSIDVRATDPAGNLGATTGYRFEVDTTSPDTAITDQPSFFTNAGPYSFSFSSSDSEATFQCAVDSFDFRSCASPHEVSSLPDGDHFFRVRARDRAGNLDPTPAYVAFKVDSQAPVVEISSGPPPATQDDEPVFGFKINDDGATPECRFEGEAFGTCSGNRSDTPSEPLPEGSYVFEVRAIDRADNTSQPARLAFVVDRTPPAAPAISTSPAGQYISSRDVTFLIDPPEPGVSLQCQIDGSAFSACGEREARTLDEGSHLFAARATDAAGNVSSRAEHAVTIDVTPPGTTIDSGPRRRGRDRTPTFSFSSSEDGVSYECALDKARFSACSNPYTKRVRRGRHRLRVRAVDRAGNPDGTAAVYRFRVVRRKRR